MVKQYCSLLLSGLFLIASLSSFGSIPIISLDESEYQQEQDYYDNGQEDEERRGADPFEEEEPVPVDGEDSNLSLLTFNFLFYIVYKLKFVDEETEDEIKPTD